jgi:hypothetical protein
MYQQLWGYKVEEKLYLGVREQKKVEYHWSTRYWFSKQAGTGRLRMGLRPVYLFNAYAQGFYCQQKYIVRSNTSRGVWGNIHFLNHEECKLFRLPVKYCVLKLIFIVECRGVTAAGSIAIPRGFSYHVATVLLLFRLVSRKKNSHNIFRPKPPRSPFLYRCVFVTS